MSRNIFDGSDGSDNDVTEFKTNEEYAKSYKYARNRELLQKYKDKGLHISESDNDSDTDSSSEEDEVIDKKFDNEFFNTLSSLKSKDPVIYDQNTRFFEGLNKDEDQNNLNGSRKKNKPISIKDYERQVLLKTEGHFSDEETEARNPFREASPTIVQEEKLIKEEFKKVVEASDDETEEAFGGIFKKRQKSKEQHDAEEADYIKWLAGKEESVQPTVEEKLKPLKNYWSNSKLPRGEKFLRDYILNKGYEDQLESEIPTYEEIVGCEDPLPLSDDEKELEKQEEFEHKFNFRFEEPDTEFIKRYPRTIESTVRRTDDRRKEKRHETKERKEAEKAEKMKELEILKEMKRKEIEEKINKLKMVTGNDELGIRDEELDEDFDPEAHDRRMQELFNDNYYAVDEGEEKPECPSDIEILKTEDYDDYDPTTGDLDDEIPHCEDDDFNMDCEYDAESAKQNLQQELIENTRGRRGRKGRRRNQFMEMIRAEKPRFDPEHEKTYEEYLDEYYKLDCEDFIGDMPCRFKYVETTPNDFGLTIEEILLAKNKELNKWASLKKAIQIRPEALEKKEARLFRMKAKNMDLKRKIFKSIYGEGSDDENSAAEEDVVDTKPVDIKNVIEDKPKSNNNNNKEMQNHRTEPSNKSDYSDGPSTSKKAKLMAEAESNETQTSSAEHTEKKNNAINKSSKLNKSNNNKPIPSQKKTVKGKNPFGVRSVVAPTYEKKTTAKPMFKGKKSNFKSNKNNTNNWKKGKNTEGQQIGDDRFKAYGINQRKFKKKIKYGKHDE